MFEDLLNLLGDFVGDTLFDQRFLLGKALLERGFFLSQALLESFFFLGKPLVNQGLNLMRDIVLERVDDGLAILLQQCLQLPLKFG